MPGKSGRFTPQEQRFVSYAAASGDDVDAARRAGYAHPHQSVAQLRTRPAIQAEIARLQQDRLMSEGLPLAVEQHIAILRSSSVAPGAKVQAIKLMYERTLGADGARDAKEPHEMSADELDQAIAKLRREVSDRSKPVIDVEPVAQPEWDITA